MNLFHALPGITALLCLCTQAFAAPLSVTDDSGATVILPHPAQRIVSLAPHATELLYAAGLGERIVGAVSYSDYPEAARAIPRVGAYNNPDLERIVALAPDLIVGWSSGNPPPQIEKLRRLGIRVYLSEPHELEAIPATIERLGRLGATERIADRAAAEFRHHHTQLRTRYSTQAPIGVFYEIWNRPLMSVNDEHLIGKVIALCGGRNVFGALPALTPTLSEEAVLAAAPEVIIASGMDAARPEWLDDWRHWTQLPAVKHGALYFIPPELIQRHSPRILLGAQQMCEQLEDARRRRATP